ncbi:MAG: PEP-utilizing enzyme, partial [Dehalococcoidia bacterium]
THAVNGLQHLSESMPEVFSELETALERLERHYRDMCDVEFTVSAGRLYILQVRIGRRSPLAAVRIAVSMAADDRFPLTKAEAVERIDSETLQQLALLGRVRGGAEPLAGGLPASPGVGVGVLCCDPDRAADLSAHGIAFVLAREETSPADIHGMVGAAALVTSLGGVASHAAVVARSWAIPAVTGLGNMDVLSTGIRVGQTFVAEGEQVTVDGGTGVIFKGNQLEGTVTDIREVGTLRAWATELGQEPGGAREEVDPGRTTDVTLLELARAVQLKGLCTPERAAAALAAGLERVNDLVEGNEQLFRDTPRGMMLTPEGRDWVLRRLEDEREAADVARLTEVYGDFMVLNHRFKRIVSEWQRGEGGGEGDDPGWEEVVSGISTIHSELQPLLGAVADEVPRLDGYVRRFVHALAAITAGDRAMLASPVKDSYHTVWFEFHEELINLCGKDRAAEEAAGG